MPFKGIIEILKVVEDSVSTESCIWHPPYPFHDAARGAVTMQM